MVNIEGTGYMYKHKSPKTLAIIGNGFDRAQGYYTDYRSFVNRVSSPYLDEFRKICENEEKIEKWYDFERNIDITTNKLFLESYSEEIAYEENRMTVAHLHEVFREVHTLLMNYLEKETSREPEKIFSSVAYHLSGDVQAVNFNYTATAERYCQNVFHIHGSIRERDILLGYDYRNEACLAEYEDMRWSKVLCREGLTFRRYLKGKKLRPNDTEYERLIQSLESYQHTANSSRGIDDEAKRYLSDFRFIRRFFKKYEKLRFPNIDFLKIEKLVMIGHSIFADEAFIDEIISKCTALKEIVLFRHDLEEDEEYEMKAEFLSKYTDNVTSERYV